MEEIPLPSSPDSPGPPGEEHVKKEKFDKKSSKQEPLRSVEKVGSKILTYSPTMVTSSPEYETDKDQGKFWNYSLRYFPIKSCYRYVKSCFNRNLFCIFS